MWYSSIIHKVKTRVNCILVSMSVDYKKAIVAHNWCIRPGAEGGLKLTCYFPTTRDRLSSSSKKDLVFSQNVCGLSYKTPMQGIEQQICSYSLYQDIIYVVCEDGKTYKILIQNSHSKRTDSKEGVIHRLSQKVKN